MTFDYSKTIALAEQLIACPSLTPNDAGCQTLLQQHLTKLGFVSQSLRFGEVDNLWAQRGNSGPLFVFAGHTDVVPPGPREQWAHDPFQPTIRNGVLYGRGAADMKGSLAAMVIACEAFITKHPQHKGSLGFLITSDEEGKAVNGTVKVVEHLRAHGPVITWCLVGEASCEQQFGDTIKIGRRGSLNGHLLIKGKQGHIAYPSLADNPIHKATSALTELTQQQWDNGNPQFPPTSFQISNIHAGTGADNVIPGQLEVIFNFRYSPASTAEQLQQQVLQILDKHRLNYEIHWRHSGKPFLTAQGDLLNATVSAIETVARQTPKLSTGGGTSDGRFIATLGCQVIEFGPSNGSIHQIDEHVKVDELLQLAQVYERILTQLLGQ
ncbi:MAG: succinyl-diaminopimelate desuccinylase [Coxiellaceae bacterium]|nr:MAG: succinyl-diaminopimelate desuccinylase [Coxiellaceae bacterium]